MVHELREKFNKKFTVEKYEKMLADIEDTVQRKLDFRICETPLFIDENFTNTLIEAGDEIVSAIQTEEFKNSSENAIPKNLVVPNEDEQPMFLQVDFAITKDENGDFLPQLIELQGFPSLYGFQSFVDEKIKNNFDIPKELTPYFNGLNQESYIELLRNTLVGETDPKHVILLEIDPYKQKTWIDFHITHKLLGIKPICISDVIAKGEKLFYSENGIEIQIKKIYNRVIFDELESTEIKSGFDFHKAYDVKWLGHPNWFFKVSKFSLPLINSKYSPKSYYLDQIDLDTINLTEYVLKPLYSFAGAGVKIDFTKEDLDKIENKQNYILQKKVEYVPVIKTPDGLAKAEIRLMYLWDDKPMLINNLLRVSKGKMIGVDFNKNKSWVGASLVYHP